jgi:hypothetical protein
MIAEALTMKARSGEGSFLPKYKRRKGCWVMARKLESSWLEIFPMNLPKKALACPSEYVNKEAALNHES